MTRPEVIRLAYRRYHRGEISLPQLLRVVAQWRTKR